jgi:MFS family permease
MTSFYGAYSSIGSLFLFTFIFGVPCGLLCASLANNKGYSPWRWFAGGVLFNILGLIAVAGLPDRLLIKQLRDVFENNSLASNTH